VPRALVLLGVLVSVATGCGSGTEDTVDPLAEAATNTRNVSSTHFRLDMDMEAQGEHLQVGGPGEITDHGRRVRMQMTMPRQELGLSGAGTARFEMIAANNTYYFRGGPFTDLPGGKTWVRVKDTEGLPDLGQNDPATMLDYLAATSDVIEKGDDQVRGVHTKHYAARIQVDKLAERASPQSKQKVEKLVEVMRKGGIDEIPLDVWVDDQGFVRRETMNWHPDGGSIEMNAEFFDFGKPVTIEIPPQNETMTIK
jgi:hypothetical protein